ncbi:uncharacterized protein SPSK_01174 [Sporothrix schenckii 1099-18]|uniref:SPRY domain-containing protein n=1 Tax=Sporothrix schenckii 1099-18 TaxID=1397361 RepID=A0A0F2LYH0_SPOSC|nr:uncharacterized protein SPSK_01174 [Sporothrix schenckii 1099-18]KJR81535.1 hypothetical protein SPSK_01174 [Sporothrix schenckii 1099-18]
MCFGSKEPRTAGDAPSRPVQLQQANNGNGKTSTYDAPPLRPPQQQPAQQRNEYAPPPGPPPEKASRAAAAAPDDDFAPPPGPPPGQASSSSAGAAGDFAPPAGPPPSYIGGGSGSGDYAPPPGPPPKVHDWESAVPDNSLLPPPPNLFSGWDRSPVNNATEEQAKAGVDWCTQFPISTRMNVQDNAATRQAIQNGNFSLQAPPNFRGKLTRQTDGSWKGETKRENADNCMVSFPPVYAANIHQPQQAGEKFTAYYEVHIARSNRKEVSLAMGFTVIPYPHFRLPGWHRGSLAVHGDDGHRYVNDMWGGKELIDEHYRFKPGGKYGIGMTFTRKDVPGGYAPAKDLFSVEVFFTDNGRTIASWDLHEETDAQQDLPVTGLEGDYDLSAAIGSFEVVDFEVIFNPSQWAWKR